MMLRFNINPNVILVIVSIALFLLMMAVLPGCYNIKKATVQHGKAVSTYPEIGADYCNRIYPCKDSVIKGDSVVLYDTLWGEGITMYDTVIQNDTVRITKQLPGKTITKTVRITDTMRVTNTAALDLCGINRDKAIQLATDYKAQYDKWRAIAKKRFWIIIGLSAAIALGLFAAIRKKIVKPI